MNRKIKDGNILDQGQRGANKVSAMAAHLATINKQPEQPLLQRSVSCIIQVFLITCNLLFIIKVHQHLFKICFFILLVLCSLLLILSQQIAKQLIQLYSIPNKISFLQPTCEHVRAFNTRTNLKQ